ncbi:MAG TPA: UbiA family prenyltransferase, partial [Dissulfurispiraceae bacterium]
MRPGKIFAYLRLMRLPDIFTAIADVLAGYLIASGPHVKWPEIAHLILSTSAIYAGGCVLNDLLDKKADEKDRPDRPIPSGMVSVREAFLLSC